jgi:hypothetical protein
VAITIAAAAPTASRIIHAPMPDPAMANPPIFEPRPGEF